MAAAANVTVRVRKERALTLTGEHGGSMLYVAGDEVELPADEAKRLTEQGFVEPT